MKLFSDRPRKKIISRLTKRLIVFVLVMLLTFGGVLLGSRQWVTAQVPTNTAALVEQAKTAYQNEQFQTAQQLLRQLIERFAQQGDRLNQAMALSNLSLTAQQMGDWETATTAIADSQRLLQQESPESREQQQLLAQALAIQGQLHLHQGQANQALQVWQKSSTLYQTLGNSKGAIDSQINQAQAYQALGMYPQACQSLLTVLGQSSKTCDSISSQLNPLPPNLSPDAAILALRNLGNVLRILGRTEDSYRFLERGLQLANQINLPNQKTEFLLDLGNTSRAIANQRITERERRFVINLDSGQECLSDPNAGKSIKFYLQAAACYRQIMAGTSDLNAKLQAELNLLSLKLQTQHWSDLTGLVSQIEDQLQQLPPNRTAIASRLKLAQNLMCLQWNLNNADTEIFPPPILQSCTGLTLKSDPSWLMLVNRQTIQNLLQSALTQSQRLGDSLLEANTLGYLGALAYINNDLNTALRLTEQARLQVSNFNHPEVAYLWQWQLGRILQRQGQINQAIAAYTTAYKLLQSLRQELVGANADLQFSFRDRIDPVYRELVDLLLQSDLPTLNKLVQSRDVIESLQIAELNNFFKEACLEGTPRQLEQIDTQAAIIYAFTLPKRLAVILTLPGQSLEVHEIPLNNSPNFGEASEIERTVQDLMQNNLTPSIQKVNLQPNQTLYDWLIRPFEATLQQRGIKTLVFVLDGILRGIPVATLHDGKQFLLEKYDLSFVPSLQLLSAPQSIQRSPSVNQWNALVGGLVKGRQGFEPLPSVQEEVQKIASLIPSTTLLNEEFTENRLQKELQASSFPIVHLATHAQFSSKAEETFLLTWNERINVKALDQLLRATEDNLIPIELLILSACETATGDNRAPLGLAGVAVRSGAKSTLATLWPVNDQSTAKFMINFYQALNQQGASRAEALRQAQLSLLQDENYQHPYYWAPFVLIGNWL